MSPWLLLTLTLACAGLTADAFRSGDRRDDPPARFWPRDWKRGMDHVSLAEQDRIFRRMRYPMIGWGSLAWIFLAMTVLLAILTAQAFLR